MDDKQWEADQKMDVTSLQIDAGARVICLSLYLCVFMGVCAYLCLCVCVRLGGLSVFVCVRLGGLS